MTTGPYNALYPNTAILNGVQVSRVAPRYFEFASPTDRSPEHRNGVSANRIRELVRQYGNNILIGFDVGRTTFNALDPEVNQEALRVARELGVRLHAYLGGPFGPTGSTTNPEEARFREDSARRLGIDTNNSNWMNEWNSWGWREATRRQVAVLRQNGFESFEIDNLWRDTRVAAAFNEDMRSHDTAGPATTRALIDVYRQAATWDPSMRVMMKNLSVTNLQGIEQAMQRGELNRARFADFHISEEGYRNQWPALERASAAMGIQLARSYDTHQYATSQAYRSGLDAPATQWRVNARTASHEPQPSPSLWRLRNTADVDVVPQQRPAT